MEYEMKPKKRSIANFDTQDKMYNWGSIPRMRYGGYQWEEAEWFDPKNDPEIEEAWSTDSENGYVDVSKSTDSEKWIVDVSKSTDSEKWIVDVSKSTDSEKWIWEVFKWITEEGSTRKVLMNAGFADSRDAAMDAGIAYYEKSVKRTASAALLMNAGIHIEKQSIIKKAEYKTKFHRDGTVTYWSVFNQRWVEKAKSVPDKELAAMSEVERNRVKKNLERIKKEAWNEADEDSEYYTQERNREMAGDDCPYYYNYAATSSSPREEGCRHPESPGGVCNEEDCPLLRKEPDFDTHDGLASKKSIIKKSQTLEELYQDLERVKRTLINLGNEQRGDNEEFYEKLHRAYEEILDAEKMLGKAARRSRWEKTAKLVKVRCNKCGEEFKLDIGDMDKERTEKTLRERQGFECPGHHVELGSPLDYWEIDWESAEEGSAPTDEEFLAKLKEQYDEVYTTDELDEAGIDIVSFTYGIPSAVDKETGADIQLDFTQSPSGKRYYYVLSRR